jgi:diphthamide biosynthesis protein 3
MADDEEQLSIYDEIEIEDMTFDETLQIYHYPCPCGDRFEIALADLQDKADIAVCPSCSLMIKVIFEMVSPTRAPRFSMDRSRPRGGVHEPQRKPLVWRAAAG